MRTLNKSEGIFHFGKTQPPHFAAKTATYTVAGWYLKAQSEWKYRNYPLALIIPYLSIPAATSDLTISWNLKKLVGTRPARPDITYSTAISMHVSPKQIKGTDSHYPMRLANSMVTMTSDDLLGTCLRKLPIGLKFRLPKTLLYLRIYEIIIWKKKHW